VLPRRVLPLRVLPPANPHFLEVGSTPPTSAPPASTPPSDPHFLEVGSTPLTSAPSTSAPPTSTPPANPHFLEVGSTPPTSAPSTSAPPASTPPSEPSLFGGGECSLDECSPCEYSPQRTLTFWRWGVIPRRVLPRRVLPSEPPAFVTNYDYLTLACVSRRGLATASRVSRAEVERTEGGADDRSLGGDR